MSQDKPSDDAANPFMAGWEAALRQLQSPQTMALWSDVGSQLQTQWLDFQKQLSGRAQDGSAHYTSPEYWLKQAEAVFQSVPLGDAEAWQANLAHWRAMADGMMPTTGSAAMLHDRRFADPRWNENPFFAALHQTYLLLSERLTALGDEMPGLPDAEREALRFRTRMLLDAISPANFPLTNPVALDKALETRGESLVKGMEHLLADLGRGQLTHTDSGAFRLGENIAITPGKVVHETPLYQLIQYSPATEKVLETPLVIFPPWINRFYILDLNPAKSFVKWAVEQGVTVFMVSWKSADASTAEVVWDDYIAAQIDAFDTIRARLGVPAVHAIGYCVAGTTLAATLAVLARRGEADKVASATFFTAQVDFEEPGDLKFFIDDAQLEVIRQLSPDGFLDGRYMAATFNLLRGDDLIWAYVRKNYLLGEDYPAFDLLHWNGDVTNLPVKWHCDYLRDLYRDNRLVQPDSLSALGVPIDLRQIQTPCYIQAGREDHIAPPDSVWKLTRQLRGVWTFVLAGSGHIAGVVNPPASGKYQFWTNPDRVDTLDDFVSGASETKGSWWPHWAEWLRAQAPATVKANGKRKPGSKGDKIIEDAPGRYVRTR